MKWKHAVLVLVFSLVSYVSACTLEADAKSVISDVMLPLAGALSGMILATVGVVMGSVGSVCSALAANSTPRNRRAVRDALDSVDAMVQEIKEDCMLVTITLAILIACFLFSNMDIPHVEFPSCAWMNKRKLVLTLAVFFPLLSLWAIYDAIAAVFSLHRQSIRVVHDGHGAREVGRSRAKGRSNADGTRHKKSRPPL